MVFTAEQRGYVRWESWIFCQIREMGAVLAGPADGGKMGSAGVKALVPSAPVFCGVRGHSPSVERMLEIISFKFFGIKRAEIFVK